MGDPVNMETLHGVRFLPVARIQGTLLGLDVRWIGARGLGLTLLLALATPAGPLSQDSTVPLWVRIAVGLSSVLAVVLTSLGHELGHGHALAGKIAGLSVRAIVLAPEGGVTIRTTSEQPHVNFRTALAGPMANALFGTAFVALAVSIAPGSFAYRLVDAGRRAATGQCAGQPPADRAHGRDEHPGRVARSARSGLSIAS